MTLAPLLTAPGAVQIHVLFAFVALALGPVALLRKSRDRRHKIAGRVWVLAMLGTALSSFAILDMRLIGPFSPIHFLSAYTLWGLWHGVAHIRRGEIKAHAATMRSLYFWAMGVAGLFTFLPGRRLNQSLFGDYGEQGFWVAAFVIGGGLLWYARQQRRAGQVA